MLATLVFLCLVYELLHVVDVVGNELVADEAAAVLGDEDIVLQTYATEVLVGLQQVVVDEVLVQTLCPPVVD